MKVLLLGIEDHETKRAADAASSELRTEVDRMQQKAEEITRHDPDDVDGADMFDILAHDFRRDENARRSAEHNER